MTLLQLLRRNIVFSMAAAGLQLLSTLVTVRMAGVAAYADFTIDLAKLSLVALVLESVPSPYAIFQSQREAGFGAHLASFCLASGALCLAAWSALLALGLFAAPSPWMGPYAVYLAAQRYLDIKVQAENRNNEYYLILAGSAALRLVLTAAGLALVPGHDAGVLWAALSISSLLAVAGWFAVRPREIRPFLRRDHGASLRRLFATRRLYFGYYLNTSLKRLRDAFMPVASSFVVTDKVELARYLLAMRGVAFTTGQLRIAEALLNNIANRAAIPANRLRQLLQLSILAQIVTFGASLFLAGQTGIDRGTMLLGLVASLYVYPYVLEIGARSDAYADDVPARVTISLGLFVAVLVAGLAGLAATGLLSAPCLVGVPLLAQSAATLSYAFTRGMAPRTVRA